MKTRTSWVKKDISALIGTKIPGTHATILGRAPSDKSGNLMVECKCECGKRFVTRLASLTSGNTTSHGCQKAKNYREYWDRRAAKMTPGQRRAIFVRAAESRERSARNIVRGSSGRGKRVLLTLSRFFVDASVPGLPKPLVDAAIRAHRKVLEKRTDILPDTGWHRINRHRAAKIAKQHGLHISEVYHILRRCNRSLPPSPELVFDDPEDIALAKEVLHLS